MKEYRVPENGFKAIRKQIIIRTLLMMCLAVGAGLYISAMNDPESSSTLKVLPYVLPIFIAVLLFSLYRGMKRQKEIFESYCLTISSNMLLRRQLHLPDVAIYKNEITSIVKGRKGGMLITGKNKTDQIIVPMQVTGREELEVELNNIFPISGQKGQNLLLRYPSVASLLTIALMIGTFTTANKWITGIAGPVLAALLCWSYYSVSVSKNIEPGVKRKMRWLWLVIAAVLFRTILVLVGYGIFQ